MANHVSIQKYRNSLKEFQDHIKSHFNDRFSLNGHFPKYNPMGWIDSDTSNYSRGVDSDLIVIFQDKRNPVGHKPIHLGGRNIYDSIAFAFNQDDDDQALMNVIFSFKKDGKITSSEAYPESVFRDLIRQINRTFRTEGVPESRKDLMASLQIFLNNEEKGIRQFDPEQSLNELLGAEGEHIKALSEQINETATNIKKDREKLEKISSSVSLEMDGSPESEQIRELQKKIDLLRAKMKRDRQKRIEEEGAEDIETSISQAQNQVHEWMNDLDKTASILKRKAPRGSLMREHLDSWLSKNMIRRMV